MTEGATSLSELGARPNYEQIMQAVPHSGFQETLRNVEIDKAALNRELEAIEQNEDLTDEAKERKADDVIARYEPKINKGNESLREIAEAGAESGYLWSLPAPEGKTLATLKASDATQLLAVNSEADGIAAKISGQSLQEMTKSVSKNPRDKGMQDKGDHRTKVLREEYDLAIQEGGVQGTIRALAVKKVCERTGVDFESVAAHHRIDRHHKALDEAQRFEKAAFSLSSKPVKIQNPFTSQGRRRRSDVTYQSRNKVLTGGSTKPLFQKQRTRRAWK